MSKNLKVALTITTIIAIAVVAFFYNDHEDSISKLTAQPVVTKNIKTNTEVAETTTDTEVNPVATPIVTTEVATVETTKTQVVEKVKATKPNKK